MSDVLADPVQYRRQTPTDGGHPDPAVSEQDANRKLTGELKQFIPTVLETVDELEKTAARQTRNLTPTQSYERAAVLARHLFDAVATAHAAAVASAYMAYYEAQRDDVRKLARSLNVDPNDFQAHGAPEQ